MSFPLTQAMRAERRQRAEALQAEYSKKYPTTAAKLAALPATGCEKQRGKLQARLDAEQNKAANEKAADAAKAEAKAAKKAAQ